MSKKQKKQDYAALERRANHKTILPGSRSAAVAAVNLFLIGVVSLIFAFWAPLWLILTVVSVILDVVAFRDVWIYGGRKRRRWVLGDPSARELSWSQRQTHIPYFATKFGVRVAPMLMMFGVVAFSVEHYAFGIVCVVVTMLSIPYCFRAFVIYCYRDAVETHEAYQRDKARREESRERAAQVTQERKARYAAKRYLRSVARGEDDE
jgi:signal transduction histidine kinase